MVDKCKQKLHNRHLYIFKTIHKHACVWICDSPFQLRFVIMLFAFVEDTILNQKLQKKNKIMKFYGSGENREDPNKYENWYSSDI